MTAEEIWEQYSAAYGQDSVEAFQRFFGLQATGILDGDTTTALSGHRCGLRDNLVIISEAKWRKRELTWYARNYLPGMPVAGQDEAFEESWRVWAEVCDKKFSKSNSIATADILYDVGDGRQDGFDGPGGVLAWMTLGTNNDNPILGKFDAGEVWNLNRLTNGWLVPVAAHENGHALNLNHAPQNSGALMAPYVNWKLWKPQSHDINAVQALYGPPQPTAPPPDQPGDEGYISHLYRDLVGRAPTPMESNHWLQILRGSNRKAVTDGILNSSEYHGQLTNDWYNRYLKRAADAGGLANFRAALNGGMPVKTALGVMLGSAEYYSLKAGTSMGLDPANPNPTTPNGGFMRDIVLMIVNLMVEYFKKSFPFLGRFLTAAMIERIVDFIMSRFGLAQVQFAASSRLPLIDVVQAAEELSNTIGAPPTS